MLAQEFIRRKRDRGSLDARDIGDFVGGITDGSVTDAQISAFAMAVFFNGLSDEETVALTLAMRDSGDVLDWEAFDRPVCDKHSTGGVGDNVSLMLAPIAAACGLAVPMISGRGLGHTGGTLDKMEAIPGYTTQPDNALFRKTVDQIGCAIIGQTADLAPADKRFYGVRDVTATVESVELITASILSKKLAAGLQSLVLDVKFGNGAFMAKHEDAKRLATMLVKVANDAGTRTTALMTDMNEPLATAAGNAVEVENAVAFLTGKHRDPRLEAVTLGLVGEMLLNAHLDDSPAVSLTRARDALTSGAAAETFGRMVHALGGPADFVERHDAYLKKAAISAAVESPRAGHVSAIATRDIGIAVVELGGGRRKREDTIDHSVGLTGLATIGTRVEKGDPLAVVHARDEATLEAAKARVLAAYAIADAAPDITNPISEIIRS